jgi:hypothetical protein
MFEVEQARNQWNSGSARARKQKKMPRERLGEENSRGTAEGNKE